MQDDEMLRKNSPSIMELIREAVDNDNIITKGEYVKIQKAKEDCNISSELLRSQNKSEFERILYLQLHLLLLDDTIDITEKQELEYYKEIFGYSEEEIVQLAKKVSYDKKHWRDT